MPLDAVAQGKEMPVLVGERHRLITSLLYHAEKSCLE
jgi:hypothetical protein